VPSQPAPRPTSSQGVQCDPVPKSPDHREIRNSTTRKSTIAATIRNPDMTLVQNSETPSLLRSSATQTQSSETESESPSLSNNPSPLRHPRDEELNFSDAAAKVPRFRRDSTPVSPLRSHVTTPAVPKRLISPLKFDSHDGKLDTFKKGIKKKEVAL
jgi:hypothetical protein